MASGKRIPGEDGTFVRGDVGDELISRLAGKFYSIFLAPFHNKLKDKLTAQIQIILKYGRCPFLSQTVSRLFSDQ
jgi:arginine/ornithine N-succinyltransferase beta subunit